MEKVIESGITFNSYKDNIKKYTEEFISKLDNLKDIPDDLFQKLTDEMDQLENFYLQEIQKISMDISTNDSNLEKENNLKKICFYDKFLNKIKDEDIKDENLDVFINNITNSIELNIPDIKNLNEDIIKDPSLFQFINSIKNLENIIIKNEEYF